VFTSVTDAYGDFPTGTPLTAGGLVEIAILSHYLAPSRVVVGWLRGSVVERRSLTGELSLSCARPAADG